LPHRASATAKLRQKDRDAQRRWGYISLAILDAT